MTMYKCSGANCPEYPYRASDMPHPASCVGPEVSPGPDTIVSALSACAHDASEEGHAMLRAVLDLISSDLQGARPFVAETRAQEHVRRLSSILPRIHSDSGERGIVQRAIEILRGVTS